MGVPTFMLAYWVRERHALPLETAVRKLSSDPAALWGIPQRGQLAPGWFADVNVLDLDRVDLLLPEVRHDLPGGAPNLSQRAAGFRTTIVNGAELGRDVIARTVLRAPIPAHVVSGPMSRFAGSLTQPGTGATSQTGAATWYDPPWSGLTAAHPWLPFGTHVTVTDLATGRSVTVVIDDRGPFSPGRIIDLSPEAFAQLAPLGHGVLRVRLDW
jgi:hypothetical protein